MHYNYLFPILLLCFFSCKRQATTDTDTIARPVRTVKVEALGTIDKSFTGVVQPEEFSILAFKVAGSLVALNVQEGQVIPEGYTIARINPEDYELKYQSAEANYQAAKAIYERTQRLLDQNATAVQNLEIARADYIQATSAVNIARKTLGYTKLTAPFKGLIEKKYVENFQKVQVGEAIVKLVNPYKLEIGFTLPETSIGLTEVPKEIYVQFDTRKNQWFKARVKEYVYSSKGSGIPVTLKIADPSFEPYRDEVYPGFSCKIIFKIENTVANKFIIPVSSLLKNDNKDYLWIVDPKTMTVHKQEVTTVRFDNQALVKEGLNSNDLIVIAGVDNLKENQKVVIQEPGK